LSRKAGFRFSESGSAGRPRPILAIIKEYP
jgi:hypothetical protein